MKQIARTLFQIFVRFNFQLKIYIFRMDEKFFVIECELVDLYIMIMHIVFPICFFLIFNEKIIIYVFI